MSPYALLRSLLAASSAILIASVTPLGRVAQGAKNRKQVLPAFAVALLLTCCGYSAQAQSTCLQPPSGAIAWWSLDETTGNTSVDRVGNHTAAWANGPVPAPGEVRGALQFNGTNYLAAQDSDEWAFGKNDFTVELWANFDVVPGGDLVHPGAIFIGSDDGPGSRNKWFFALGGGLLHFTVYNTADPPPNFYLVRAHFTPIIGQWYHLAVRKRGTLFTIYVNGTAVGSETSNSPIANASAPLTIAQAENLGFIKGRLDEITMYNRALAPEEIMAIYVAGTAGKCVSMSIRPSAGGDTGMVTAQINGVGFQQGATVTLSQAGQTDITGNLVTVADDGTSINTTFDLVDQARGAWDVVVTNPDTTRFTLSGAFTIEAGTALQPWVDFVGLPVIRLGVAQNYWVAVGNSGNTNIPSPEIFLDGSSNVAVVATNDGSPITVPEGSQLHAWVVDLAPGQVAYLPLLLTANDSNEVQIRAGVSTTLEGIIHQQARNGPIEDLGQGDGGLVPKDPELYENTYPAHKFNCGTAPAGYLCTWYDSSDNSTQQGMSMGDGTVRWSIGPDYPNGTATIKYDDIHRLYPALVDMGADRPYYCYGCYQDRSIVPPEQMTQLVLAATQKFVPPPDKNFIKFCNPSDYGKTGECISCADLYLTAYEEVMKAVQLNKWYYEDFTATFYQGEPYNGKFRWTNKWIIDEFDRRNARDTHKNAYYETTTIKPPDDFYSIDNLLEVIFSFDPNDKVGSKGVGEAQYLTGQQPLRYSVLFENKADASAPVQQAVVTDQLDIAKLDLSTFNLGLISFGSHQLTPPPGSTEFAQDVDLRPATSLIVRTSASLNPNTGLVTWRFTSIDPLTGDPPTDPRIGFLPPNVNPPEGDGSVLFNVMPKQGLATDTQILNQATIVFDANPPMNTPTWFNTLDNTPPTSAVSALPGSEFCLDFTVQWSGTDLGAGIQDYTVYVSDNGGQFTPWLTNTSSTSGVFNGQLGHTYSFYSIARDLVGNVEPPKNSGEANTRITKINLCGPIPLINNDQQKEHK